MRFGDVIGDGEPSSWTFFLLLSFLFFSLFPFFLFFLLFPFFLFLLQKKFFDRFVIRVTKKSGREKRLEMASLVLDESKKLGESAVSDL